ncbi:hypothetical protein HYV10_01405 [Candidatus Dependentiae bacterium]|nr:hypothetical protein [Candidatus Dependentiae bacterium]
MNKKINFILAIILCLNVNIMHTENKNLPEKWITVFIHGSFSLRPHLGIRNIFKMLYDTIEESIYYRSTEINRRDPFFYKNQAMSGLGLHKINIYDLHKNAAAPILAASFEEISLRAGYPKTDEYYTFGWSGLVSNKLRFLEGAFLYQDLQKIFKKYQNEGYDPRVRLIGYSHGGNLALQLGAIYKTKPDSERFYIDELWLLGTPIQVETDYLINSPIFNKIFNFYSRADKVQTLDFFSFKRFFSNKKFSKRNNFKIPEKLYQIRIKVTKYESISKKHADKKINDAKSLRYFKEINYDPGHFELWFMGWTILTYRQTFPFYPLPILTFLPLVTGFIEKTPNVPHDIVADFKPDLEKIEIKPYHTVKNKYYATIPFISNEFLKHMQEHSIKYIPNDYNIEIYNQKVYGAMNIAEHEWKEIKKLLKEEKKNKKTLEGKINLHKNDESYQGHIPAS